MKVITEERLREIQSSITDGRSKLFMKLLINECQYFNTITAPSEDLISAAESYAEKYTWMKMQ